MTVRAYRQLSLGKIGARQAEHQLKDMIEALRDLVGQNAARRGELVYEEQVRSLNNDARQIALA